ncbi:glycosyltransferase [Myxococcus stipitatus]|uniref:glycosyltransferase n=1 Tax=Myxococcus stipitatus TaxID=83455 RepID=UPI001F334DC2|nr:glycosyltransferase [Myxococcus stipitatus]MCE9672706.1 glycosyltransferase [Myxococcus stipitatus]
MSRRRVCLVTEELYPFSKGGIGRVIHNLVMDSLRRRGPVELHLLLPSGVPMTASEVEAYFDGGVRAHVAEARAHWETSFDEGGVYPPPAAFTDTRYHAQSLELMLELRRLESAGVHFDTIEFPDYLGWAFCTLQEKLLGSAFANTEVSVRLHSTWGILVQMERQLLTPDNQGQVELERKALLDADRIVAHLPRVAEFNHAFYRFPESWKEKVVCQFPPVSLEPPGTPRAREWEVPDLLFVSKVQYLKRPDLFIRGAVLFMRTHPEFTGRAVLDCFMVPGDHLTWVKSLVPPDLSARFVFTGPSEDREALMRRGIVVIPSDYESLNLAAYEAAAVGAPLVLNERCVAFAPGGPFRDGVNCRTFDGSVEGLAAALERAWRAPDLKPVEWTADIPYWEEAPRAKPTRARQPAGRTPLVSVLVTNFNLARYLPEALGSVAESDHPELEIILVDDASTDPFDQAVMERIETAAEAGGASVRLIRNRANRGLPASRNLAIDAAKGEYVLPLDADDCINPRFIRLAVDALERHREFDVVVPSTGYFDSDEALAERRFCDYAMFIGDCPSLGMVANRLSCATSLMRRSLFEHTRYDEQLRSYEDWDLYLRLAHAGHRFLVTNAIHFHYRRRGGSMISEVNPRRHLELLAQLHRNLPRPLPEYIRLEPFLLLAMSPEAPTPALEGPGYLQGAMDRLNGSLKRVPLLHKALKYAATELASDGGGDRPARHVLADALGKRLDAIPGLKPVVKQVVKTARQLKPRKG